MKVTIETPWGAVQTSKHVAPGIIRYDTASHGGYYVAPEMVMTMPPPLRNIVPFAGKGWYEEDCDWCIVVLAFPTLFPPGDHAVALDTLRHYHPDAYEAFCRWQQGKK